MEDSGQLLHADSLARANSDTLSGRRRIGENRIYHSDQVLDVNEVLDVRAVTGDVNPTNLAFFGPFVQKAVARRSPERYSLDVGRSDYTHWALGLGSLKGVFFHPELPFRRCIPRS